MIQSRKDENQDENIKERKIWTKKNILLVT